MRHNEGEPQRNPFKRAWEAITRRGKKEPSIAPPPPLAREPSPFPQRFEQFFSEQERLRQEATVEEQDRQRQAENATLLRRQEEEARIAQLVDRLGQKKAQEDMIGSQTLRELEPEVQGLHLNEVAMDIKEHLWRSKLGLPITVSPLSRPQVVVWNNELPSYEELRKIGEVLSSQSRAIDREIAEISGFNLYPPENRKRGRRRKAYEHQKEEIKKKLEMLDEQRSKYFFTSSVPVANRSMVGWELAYKHLEEVVMEIRTSHAGEGGEEFTYAVTEKAMLENKLSFGIGYFGNRSEIIAEARQFATDQELQEGVKAYFVSEQYGKTRLQLRNIIIPTAFPESLWIFSDQIENSAIRLNPENRRL